MKTKVTPQLIAIVSLGAAALLVGAIGYFAMISPEQKKATKLGTDIANAQVELTVGRGAAARPVPFTPSDLYRFANAMPSRTDMPGILLGLRHLADQSKVKLTSVRPSSPVPMTLGYSALPLGVTVTGNYAGVTKFLALIHRDVRFAADGTVAHVGGRLFDADSIQLQGSNTTGAAVAAAAATASGAAPKKAPSNTLTAQLSLDAFVYTGVVIAPTPPADTSTTGTSTTSTTTTTSGGQ